MNGRVGRCEQGFGFGGPSEGCDRDVPPVVRRAHQLQQVAFGAPQRGEGTANHEEARARLLRAKNHAERSVKAYLN